MFLHSAIFARTYRLCVQARSPAIHSARAPHSRPRPRSWRARGGIWRPSTQSAAAADQRAAAASHSSCSSSLAREDVVEGSHLVLCPNARGERVALLSKCVGKGDARAEPRVQERGCAQHGCSRSLVLQVRFGQRIACVQVHRKNRRCVQRPRGRVVEARAIFCFRRGHQSCSVPGRDGAHRAGSGRRPLRCPVELVPGH